MKDNHGNFKRSFISIFADEYSPQGHLPLKLRELLNQGSTAQHS